MKNHRKLIALVLAAIMLVSLLPVAAVGAPGDLTEVTAKLTGVLNSDTIGNLETDLIGYIIEWPAGYEPTSVGLIPWSDTAPTTTGQVDSAFIWLGDPTDVIAPGGGDCFMSGLSVQEPENAPPGDYRFVVYAKPTAGGYEDEEILYGSEKVKVIDGIGFKFDITASTLEITDGGGLGESTELTLTLDFGTDEPVSLLGTEILDLAVFDDDLGEQEGNDFGVVRPGANFSAATVSPDNISIENAGDAFISMLLPAMTVVDGKLTIVISGVLPIANSCKAIIKLLDMEAASALGHWEDVIEFTGSGSEGANITLSTLTVPPGSVTGAATALTLNLKPSETLAYADDDTITITATGLDFTNASAPEGYAYEDGGSGTLTISFVGAGTLPAAGTNIVIGGVASSLTAVTGASVTLTRAGESDLTKVFGTLFFGEPVVSYEDCTLDVQLSTDTWVLPVSGVFGTPVTATIRLLDENDDVVDASGSGYFTLDGLPYFGLNDSGADRNFQLVHGEATYTITHLTSFRALANDTPFKFRATAYVFDPSIQVSRSYVTDTDITISFATRFITGHVDIDKGDEIIPYANAPVYATMAGHSYSSGKIYTIHPSMVVTGMTDASGNYSIALPSPHVCPIRDDEQLYSVSVPANADTRTLPSASVAVNWANPNAPTAPTITLERAVIIHMKVYEHTIIDDWDAPTLEADRRDAWVDLGGDTILPPNRVVDSKRYSHSLYNANTAPYSTSFSYDEAGDFYYITLSYLNSLTNNGATPLRLRISSAAFTGRSYQQIEQQFVYNPAIDEYEFYADFAPDGFIEVVNPDIFEGNTEGTEMAVRIFGDYLPNSISYLAPGQRVALGQFTSDTDVVALVVPKEYAALISAWYSWKYYDSDTDTWSIPGMEPGDYYILRGTAGIGKKVSLRNTVMPVADSTKYGEIPDNVSARVVSTQGNSVTVALSMSSVSGDFHMGDVVAHADSGLGLNAGDERLYYIMPNMTKGVVANDNEHGVSTGLSEVFLVWGNYSVGFYNEKNQHQWWDRTIHEGETIVIVVTFDLKDPDEPEGTVHTMDFTYETYGYGLDVQLTSLSFTTSPNPTLRGTGYTEQNYLEVSGVASANADIELFVDGEPAKLIDTKNSTDSNRVYLSGSTVQTNKAGQYTATVELFGGKALKDIDPGATSEIYAVDGARQTNSVFVRYAPGMPKVAALGDLTHKAVLISPPRHPWYTGVALSAPFNDYITYRYYPPSSGGGGGSAAIQAAVERFTAKGIELFEKFGLDKVKLALLRGYDWTGILGLDLGFDFTYNTGWQWTETGPVILRYDPGEALEYRVVFDSHDDEISKVWVNIENAAGGKEYVMPAVYDSAQGYWVATGELPTIGFVPGTISVDYILKLGSSLELAEEALSALQNRPNMTDPQIILDLMSNEFRTYAVPTGVLEDENLADDTWRQIVESTPDLATMSVTGDAGDWQTVSYNDAVEGLVSVTGRRRQLDSSDPNVLALAQQAFSSKASVPLGSDGTYAVRTLVHYTQGGEQKSMEYTAFLKLISDSQYESARAACIALGIDFNVTAEYTEFVRLPDPLSGFALRALDSESFDTFCTEVGINLDGFGLMKDVAGVSDEALNIGLKNGKSIPTSNILSVIGSVLGLKDIWDNVSANCDIKFLLKEYSEEGSALQRLMFTECFGSMDSSDKRLYYQMLDDYSKMKSDYDNWARNAQKFNNMKVLFTSGSIMFTAATGGGGSALTNAAIGAASVTIGTADVVYGAMGVNDMMVRMISAHTNQMRRFEAAFTRYMYKKCGDMEHTIVEPRKVKVIFDPSGFAYENGDFAQRVAGVTAEIWQADDENGTNARLWTEADEYGEVNPQITGEDGWYAWDVPIGWWQVRLTKEGYEDAQSAWLPVLPVQLGVNIEMKAVSTGNPGGGNPGGGNPGGGGGGSGSQSGTTIEDDDAPLAGWRNPFVDVHEDDWFYGDVEYVHVNGLFNGTSATTFSPDAPMTRAMLITVLARLSGVDTDGGETWYSKAVQWGTAIGITDGTRLNDSVTRREIATMLYRYAKIGADGYGGEALAWVQAQKIMNDGRPADTATRAEVAAMLRRYAEAIR
jgi:hypothetical protein